jgi:hypothetical protein
MRGDVNVHHALLLAPKEVALRRGLTRRAAGRRRRPA